MAVYYKFKSAKDNDSIPIDGQFISVANFKERIFESKHLGRGTDFDLMVSNAQNDEEYDDEAAMIPKNTSVLIRRVPGCRRMPIVTEQEEPKDTNKLDNLPSSSGKVVGDLTAMKFPEEPEWDEFGNDLYAIPEVHPAPSSTPAVDFYLGNKVDEDSKIKALIDTPALDWNRQSMDSYGQGRGFGRGMGGRMIAGRGFGRGRFDRKTPPAGYVCYRCKIPGHLIQHCPTNGDPTFDLKRVKPPTGIPRSMLMATPDGSYALPSGAVAVLKPNEAAFEKEIEGLPTSRPVSDLPPELRCPLCKEVMKDAVLTSKCCFSSFCDKCIREYIISKSMCVCGATNILADDLLPNKTLRETINRILETTTSSTENAGSIVQIQDMESACPMPPKPPSPTTLSATSKDEAKPPPLEHTQDIKTGENTSEAKTMNVEKMPMKSEEPLQAMLESTSAKEVALQASAPAPEDAQEKQPVSEQVKKKKKKTRPPVTGADMQWKAFQDLGAENYAGMPMQPSAYNPYWMGGMPMGMDPYMGSFTGAMPFVGYAPGTFDVPYGGMLPQNPLGAQGYMLPPYGPQRDLSELGMASMNVNHAPPHKGREEFDARKTELRKKRDLERFPKREQASRERGSGGEVGGVGADLPHSKSKPRHGAEPGGGSDQHDRRDRTDRASASGTDRRHVAPRDSVRDRDSSRHSPHRSDRRSRVPDEPPAAAEAAKNADRKHKGSVFSRISFPAEPSGGDKKRKASEMNNGVKDHHDAAAAAGNREDVRRSGGGGESSEEDHHFKRRPSSSSRKDAEEDGRPSRRGSKDRDHHDRVSSSRRSS